jgi:hypothetical protein
MKMMVLGIILALICFISWTNHKSCASTIILPQTGQFQCYSASRVMLGPNSWTNETSEVNCTGTGQDGDLKAGAAWPSPRIVDNGDGTVTDNLTALQWAKNANLMQSRDPDFDNDSHNGYDNSIPGDGKVTWQHALDYIKKLNAEGYAGYNDWRLPNALEIASLDHIGSFDIYYGQTPSLIFNVHDYFDSVNTSYYWSSTTCGGHSGAYAQLGGFRICEPKIYNKSVWPVRGVTSGNTAIPQTGQTTCYDTDGNLVGCVGTGQDGDTLAGIARPQQRFSDNSDGTVTDNLTGLIWPRETYTPAPTACLPGSLYEWRDISGYIRCLNANAYLGYSDWRLPNIIELSSLTDFGQNNDNWLYPDYFSAPLSNGWSSTFYLISGMPDMIWTGDYGIGGWDLFDYKAPVSPVRGGTFPDIKQFTVTGRIEKNLGRINCAPALVDSGNSSVCSFVVPDACPVVNVMDNATDVTGLFSNNNYMLNSVIDNHFIIATTACQNKFVLYITPTGTGNGSVTSNPPGMVCNSNIPAGCEYAFDIGSSVELIAKPDWKSTFSGWSGDLGVGSGNIITVTDPFWRNQYVMYAEFEINNQAKVSATGIEYPSIMDAYRETNANTSIKARVYTFYEDLILNKELNIILDGGKDADYALTLGATTISGTLCIERGSVQLNDVVIM